jgi:ATP-dependent protease ClpP protease subunit
VASGQDWFRIVNKSENGEDKSEVYIYDEIGFWGTSASEFVRQVAAITSPKIDLHLNSPGGEIFDGVAIYNSLKSHHAEVTVYVDSLAASAASFIAQAGDKVLIARNATMMIHDGIAFTYGNSKDHTDTANLLDKLSNNIADIYQQRAGGTVEDWRNLMREEVWYNATEAVDAGLADDVFEPKPSEDTANKKFNLVQLFNYSSRKEAPSPDLLRERVFNRVKEARNMGTPTNGHEDGTPQEENPRLAGQPEQEQVQQQEEEEQSQQANSPDGSQPAPPAQVGEVPVTPAPAPENRASVSFMVNGVKTTDLSAVQNHINVLEATLKESKEANRKEFIKNLAGTGKITAAQMTATEAFVATLNDQQYESWVASWDAAPSLPLLGDHAATGTSAPAQNKAENDNLEVAKAIVRQHKLAGMAMDKIKETPSYKSVVAADPEFQL